MRAGGKGIPGGQNSAPGGTRLPLAVQVHHGVCDGFHVCRFVNEMQELLGQREIFRP